MAVGSPIDPARSLTPVLVPLHVEIPASEQQLFRTLWSHVREDVLPADVSSRLRANGVRAGVGLVRTWDSVRAALDSAPGRLVHDTPSVALPPRFPVMIELDAEPRDQTLFLVSDEGELRGKTWQASRNVLRLAYLPDAQRDARMLLNVTPTVWQPEGPDEQDAASISLPEWLGSPAPRFTPLAEASFTLALSAGEYLLVGPSDNADVPNLLGRTFLTANADGRVVYTLLFLKLEPAYAAASR